MITARLKIGDDGAIQDTYEQWGFIYLSGDRRFSAPEKARDVTSYAEEAGEHMDLRSVPDAFDYKVKFLINTYNSNSDSANAKIAAFNAAIREGIIRTVDNGDGTTSDIVLDVTRCKTVTFYDDYKRVKIVGVPSLIGEVGDGDYYRRQDGSVLDCVVVELLVRVINPTLCEWNLSAAGIFTDEFTEEFN